MDNKFPGKDISIQDILGRNPIKADPKLLDNDIKNNRLQLLKMFCDTFNNFINFSKLEGTS